MSAYNTMPPIKPPALGNRYSQNTMPPIQAPPGGISPGVQALMNRALPVSSQNLPVPLATLHAAGGAPGVQPVQPGQFNQAQPNGLAKPMQMHPQSMPQYNQAMQQGMNQVQSGLFGQQGQPQPMPPQPVMQNQNPQPGQIVDPYMRRRLAAFGPLR